MYGVVPGRNSPNPHNTHRTTPGAHPLHRRQMPDRNPHRDGMPALRNTRVRRALCHDAPLRLPLAARQRDGRVAVRRRRQVRRRQGPGLHHLVQVGASDVGVSGQPGSAQQAAAEAYAA
ncbi:hypothetical protein MCOR25_009493 [Pyricularia grisea]|nr:hypothetical protein MCOR25_009493 [Pyricularia grisea]